jgi:NOL1/NOP2/sun family putative RNA methylase
MKEPLKSREKSLPKTSSGSKEKKSVLFEAYSELIPDFQLFQEALFRPLPTHLRINTLKARAGEVVSALRKKGVLLHKSLKDDDTLYTAPRLTSPGNLLEYFMGHIHPQALTSCLAALTLSPGRETLVLDLCSSPGGKTSHLAQLMGNTGLVVANELYANRRIPLGNTLTRLGVLNSVVTGYQAQEFPLKQKFDYILADVPCSGEGRFRRIRPEFTYSEPREKALLPALQKKIIRRGFELLKPGGKMIYATCTYNPAENEEVVDCLLNEQDARLLPIDLDVNHVPGITRWRGKTYARELEVAIRCYPHYCDSVGFFLAGIGRPG